MKKIGQAYITYLVIFIVFLLIVVGLLWYKLTIDKSNAEITVLNEMKEKNDITSNANTKSNKTNNDIPDEIAKELFIKGAAKIREFTAEGASWLIYSDLNGEMIYPLIEKNVNGISYAKTTLYYKEVVDKYSELFTGEALDKIISNHFLDVDGILYVLTAGGMSGWDITNIKVTSIGQNNDKHTYKATFNNVEGFDEYAQTNTEILTSEFVIEKVGSEYKISSIDYLKDSF